MTFDPDKPFSDLPLLPPPMELESRAVLKKAIAANKAVAGLKGVGELIPNQLVLIQALGLQEAKLSSEIENIVTTNDELYLMTVSGRILIPRKFYVIKMPSGMAITLSGKKTALLPRDCLKKFSR